MSTSRAQSHVTSKERAAGAAHDANPGSSHGDAIDVRERGAEGQTLNERLFMQLLVVRCRGPVDLTVEYLKSRLKEERVASVLYADVNDPWSIGLLTWSGDPSDFVSRVRPILVHPKGPLLDMRNDMTMLGRTYSTGYETHLAYWLTERPVQTVLKPEWPWAVWYPLRRTGAFARLDPKEQGAILREHGQIGRAYGEQDLAHDIRLACHGLDTNDNEFVIGLIGASLHPLSHVVQSMRKTRQTSEYIEKMGPFFVGRALWQYDGDSDKSRDGLTHEK